MIAALVLAIAPGASAATRAKKKTPVAKAPAVAPGKPCPKVGTTDASTGLDCVQVGGSKLWEARGTKVNPFQLNDTGKYTAYEGNQYTLKITGITTLTPADIKPGGTGKYPMPGGARFLFLHLRRDHRERLERKRRLRRSPHRL